MEQALSFEGTGLDLDNNYATVNPGDSPFRLNCRYGSTDRSDLGGIQNFKGDTLITQAFGKDAIFEQPPGENEVIGSCKDLERDAIIYFVWNDPGDPNIAPRHQIRRYYTQTNEIQIILESPILNFKRNYKIFHANVVDKYLSWTDGYMNPEDEWDYNPPRQIDMELAYGYMLGLPWPQGYQTIDEQTLDAIRYAPQLCPTFQYENDLNFNDNRLYGHLFQFGYRYVYYDNSRSVISPLSKLTLPQGEYITETAQETYSGNNYVTTQENKIKITYNTGHYTVKFIEIVAKEGASWKVVESIDKYDENGNNLVGGDDVDYSYDFYNTKFIAEIPPEEALRPFDYLPQVASAQEVISSQGGARRVYGAYVEGYENVDGFDMSASVGVEKFNFGEIDPVTEIPITKKISFKRKGGYAIGVVYSDKTGRKSFVQTTDSCSASIPWWRQDSVDAYYDQNDEWTRTTNQKPYINWTINSNPPSWATSYQIVCTKDLNNQPYLYGFYNFGLCVGNDRNGQFQTGKNTLYIPPKVGYDFTKGDRIRIIAQFNDRDNPNVTYNSNAQIGFSTQQVYFAKKLGTVPQLEPLGEYQLETFASYGASGGDAQILDYPILSFDPSTQRIKIEGNLFLDFRTLYRFEIYNPNVEIAEENNLFYEIGETYKITDGQHEKTEGKLEGIDVFVREQLYKFEKVVAKMWASFATKDASEDLVDNFRIPQIPFASPLLNSPASWARHVVDATFQRGVLFTQQPPPPDIITGLTSIPGTANGRQTSVLLDGALERKGDITIKDNNSIAGVYGLNGGSYLVTATQNQGVYTDLKLGYGSAVFYAYNTNGQQITSQHNLGPDATLTTTIPGVEFYIFNIPIESHSYSDYYPSDIDQAGRPYIINKEAVRRKYFANLIWGGQFFDNTLLNFFSRYESDSVLKLNERYNEITKIQEVGFMLKVRQRNKSTSIYIGRTELTNADGSSNLAASNNVLGTINVSDEIWGGTNGTADCRSIRDTYFFDYINGTVVRDATNGLVAISGNLVSQQDPYRMTAFFRDLSDWFKANESSAEVVSTWDNHTQSVIFTIRRLGGGDNPRPIPDFVAKYKLEEAWNEGLTLSFHEPTNRWQTFHSYVREWYEGIGNTLVSFNKGDLYLHYSNDNRTEYMGVRYPIITAQICNQYTNNVKVFDNIDVYSNRKWKAEGSPILDDIYILPNAQFPNGMRSKLSYNNFIGKEGKWHSTFLCDINSPGFNNTLLALMNGRRLRGEAMKVALRNEDIDEVFLRQVIFHFTPSELSGGG